jgi:hypothetical protein
LLLGALLGIDFIDWDYFFNHMDFIALFFAFRALLGLDVIE